MYSHIITYKTLKDAIEVAFSNDNDILKFYDPNKQVSSISEITNDILNKIRTHDDGQLIIHGVYEKNELIGYFVYRNKLLISFSINVEHRNKHSLKSFFRLIKSEIKGNFTCMLWSRNIRAVKWLEKQGAKIIHLDPLITQLVCQ